jgi:hypothetical protein
MNTAKIVTIVSRIDGSTFTGQIIDRYQTRPGGIVSVEFVTTDGMSLTALEDDIEITPAD